MIERVRAEYSIRRAEPTPPQASSFPHRRKFSGRNRLDLTPTPMSRAKIPYAIRSTVTTGMKKSPAHLGDEELLRLMPAGDGAAFAQLYQRRQSGVYRFALRMTGANALAEDITQDVFLILMRERWRTARVNKRRHRRNGQRLFSLFPRRQGLRRTRRRRRGRLSAE